MHKSYRRLIFEKNVKCMENGAKLDDVPDHKELNACV